MSRGRILVIRGGAIGDFILTLPAIAALRKQFPQTRLEVLGYPHIASLATLGLGVLAVKSIEAGPLAGFFARNGNLDSQLCDYFAGFNIIVSYLFDPDKIFQTNIGRCSKAQFIAGPHRPPDSGPLHATEVFLQPLERLAVFGADPIPRIILGPQPSSRILAIHPGSGSERKNWPEPRWAELLRRIAGETDWPVQIITGEAEQQRAQRLAALLPSERVTVASNEPLTSVARRLAECRYFLGHDSGITHLAAAVGLAGIALWGPSNPNVWRPRSEKIAVLQPPGELQDLAASAVFERLGEAMANASDDTAP